MIKTKPTFIEEDGERKFVVFSMKDYNAITEALEDAYDVRLIEESKRESAGKPNVTQEQMLKELGLKPTRRKATRS